MWGFDAKQWANLIAVGLLSHFAGYYAINHALGHLRATSVSVALVAQPVVTAILAVFLLHEPLGAAIILGGLIVIGGLVLALVAFNARKVSPPV
jgi:drug/metabolite transporter (DMT)-like permease